MVIRIHFFSLFYNLPVSQKDQQFQLSSESYPSECGFGTQAILCQYLMTNWILSYLCVLLSDKLWSWPQEHIKVQNSSYGAVCQCRQGLERHIWKYRKILIKLETLKVRNYPWNSHCLPFPMPPCCRVLRARIFPVPTQNQRSQVKVNRAPPLDCFPFGLLYYLTTGFVILFFLNYYNFHFRIV